MQYDMVHLQSKHASGEVPQHMGQGRAYVWMHGAVRQDATFSRFTRHMRPCWMFNQVFLSFKGQHGLIRLVRLLPGASVHD